MKTLSKLIESSEEWLMERILMYAEDTGYTAYTSTLKEAWRLSISGLSQSLLEAMTLYSAPPKFGPDFDFVKSSIAQFGVLEAQRHRKRGVSFVMFMGLMKYYRQTYIDLLELSNDVSENRGIYTLFVDRIFDIIEISFSAEWAGSTDDQIVKSMQTANLAMTNEKNKYLTIFESLSNPVLLIDQDGFINNMNNVAAMFFNTESVPGSHYYTKTANDQRDNIDKPVAEVNHTRTRITELLPWLNQELQDFKEGRLEKNPFVKQVTIHHKEFKFNIRISEMLDVSKKYNGMVLILEDISKLAASELEIQKLSGLIPICSHCKNMRDDKGYWSKLEQYIEERSDALFSHSICESCLAKYYPEID